MIYMDTSALVIWLTRRNHWAELDAFLQLRLTQPLATSTLGFVETVRTLDLMGHFPEAMEDLDARITEILPTREVRDGAALLVGGLRTSDAIHVAGAVSSRDDLTAPVTYDRRMLDTARAEGLSAHAPGMAERRENTPTAPTAPTVGTRQRARCATVGARFSGRPAVPIGFRGTRPAIERVIR